MPASTVTEYLAALSPERREALNEVRRGINRALPPGYKEGIQFGMISWFEWRKDEPEIGGIIDWRLTADPELARMVRAQVPDGWLRFGGLGQ